MNKNLKTLRKEEYEIIADYVQDAFWSFNIDKNKFVFVSPNFESIWGYSQNEIINDFNLIKKSVHPDDKSKFLNNFETPTSNNIDFEWRIHDKNGDLHHIRTQGKYAENAAHKDKVYVGVHIDITKNETLKTMLVHNAKMSSLGQMVAGITHEINNPLGYTLSNVVMLREYFETIKKYFNFCEDVLEKVNDTEKNQAELKKLVSKIKTFTKSNDLIYIFDDLPNAINDSEEGVIRARDIVASLMNYCHTETKKNAQTDINNEIESAIKMVWHELKYKCTLHKNLTALPKIQCDSSQINQVFINLLINAHQAIENTGKITLETKHNDNEIVIKISDDGPGIKSENLKNLFNPFFTTKTEGKGTGLGLAICHEIIQKHHGSIEVSSQVGQGSTFTVKLPVTTSFQPTETG